MPLTNIWSDSTAVQASKTFHDYPIFLLDSRPVRFWSGWLVVSPLSTAQIVQCHFFVKKGQKGIDCIFSFKLQIKKFWLYIFFQITIIKETCSSPCCTQSHGSCSSGGHCLWWSGCEKGSDMCLHFPSVLVRFISPTLSTSKVISNISIDVSS